MNCANSFCVVPFSSIKARSTDGKCCSYFSRGDNPFSECAIAFSFPNVVFLEHSQYTASKLDLCALLAIIRVYTGKASLSIGRCKKNEAIERGRSRGTESCFDDKGNSAGIQLPGIRYPNTGKARGVPRHSSGQSVLYHPRQV